MGRCSSYITPPTSSANNGEQFSVVVTNSAGSVTSSNATLTVTPVVATNGWAKNAGGLTTDRGNSIAVDGSGNSYITGSFQATATV